jgi:hypothetical protein
MAVKRGAFDADEVGAVSELYKKVKAFVEQFNKPAESTEQK